MNKIIKAGILLAVGLFLTMTFSAYAEVPPPPVNQNLGIPDTVFDSIEEEDCRVCHGANPPPGVPVDPTYLPDRHHLLVDTPIPPNSSAPNGDPNGDGLYECLSCHTEVWNPVIFAYQFAPFRDCNLCHAQEAGEPTVHHATAEAQAGDCQACHGSFVDNGLLDDDGDGIRNAIDYDDTVNPMNGWVPNYQVSLVTPWPSGKPNAGDGDAPNEGGIKDEGDLGAGNCNYCHNTIALPGVKPSPTVDPDSGVLVYQNDDTHHSTGFILDSSKCNWCHFEGDPTAQPISIRTCENCHGIPSVHNIQLGLDKSDSGPGVTPGQEPPWNGHIGEQKDCWGCHGNNGQIMSAPGTGPITPFITSLSSASFTEGTAATLSVNGEGFINSVQNPMTGAYDTKLDCDVKLVDDNGQAIILEPVSVTPTRIEVMMPADLAAGAYQLSAKKGPRSSNPMTVLVTKAVAISSASCSGGVVTITGSGFSKRADAANAGTNVSSGSQMGAIISWSDDQIVSNLGTCPTDIKVVSLFGEATSAVQSDPSAVASPMLERINRKATRAGRTIRLYGQNFGDGTVGKVMFGPVEADVRSWSTTLIKIRVPAAAPKGSNGVYVEVSGQVSDAISVRKR